MHGALQRPRNSGMIVDNEKDWSTDASGLNGEQDASAPPAGGEADLFYAAATARRAITPIRWDAIVGRVADVAVQAAGRDLQGHRARRPRNWATAFVSASLQWNTPSTPRRVATRTLGLRLATATPDSAHSARPGCGTSRRRTSACGNSTRDDQFVGLERRGEQALEEIVRRDLRRRSVTTVAPSASAAG